MRGLALGILAGACGALACGGGGGSGADGGTGPDGSIVGQDAAPPPPPKAVCDLPAQPVDTSKPTTVVGDGSPASCTDSAFRAAVAAGGIVTFDCGANPVTITVASEVPVSKDTTIDGAGTVTLSGGGTSRILHITSAWNVATPLLTVQNLTFTGGFTSDVLNTKSTAKGGGAIFEDGGSLTVIDCTFTHNQCATTGQDVSGGAINGQGVGTLIIVGSTFSDNTGSNGGAVGTQDENVTVVNSTFANNSATGTDGNPGNGGNGGGLTYDGAHVSLTLCGDTFTGNKANAAGGAVFRVGYNSAGGAPSVVNIDRYTFDGNSVDASTGNAAGLYLENVTINMSGTTISNNTGHYGGGIWCGQSATANFTNVTIADNTASGGGGVWFANGVTGTFLNCTVAGNTGDGLFGGDTGVSLQNTIVANNVRGTLDGTTNCAKQHGSSGPNLQFPGTGTLCAPSITVADPLLGALQDNGGPTKTMLPASGSPALGKGTGCPPIDQRGNTRPSACTLGAVEAN
ncbi:MAG TPA: right-handed parallel beta-helix repeat-containing protein [Polyangiaceae bacterium]|nr:right-handed parallel beta-helix repeat-containing protein [Polyangiaceae bacterium]